MNLNDGATRGGVESDVTTAFNWYLYSNLRLLVNWVYAHRNSIGDQNVAMARLSLDFWESAVAI